MRYTKMHDDKGINLLHNQMLKEGVARGLLTSECLHAKEVKHTMVRMALLHSGTSVLTKRPKSKKQQAKEHDPGGFLCRKSVSYNSKVLYHFSGMKL
jgi:hypothetical protein